MVQELDKEVRERAAQIEEKLIAWRRDIHEHPELGEQETRTSALVAEHSDWGQPLDIVIEIAVCAALAGRRRDAQSLLDAAAARARASGYEGDVINELVSPIAATIGLAADPTRIMLAPTLPELVSTARVLVVNTLASAPANKP